MVKLALLAAIYGIAATAGFGIISKTWLIGAIFAAYVLSILDESKSAPDEDFGNLESEEFMASELNIKKSLGIRLVYAGILYFLSFGISQII